MSTQAGITITNEGLKPTLVTYTHAYADVQHQALDPFPLASATVAQVHRAVLLDGQPVVVKVQHPRAARLMRDDLTNMRLLSDMLTRMGLDLGFDHGSLVKEYQLQVPMEFDFAREARNAADIRCVAVFSECASRWIPFLQVYCVSVWHIT